MTTDTMTPIPSLPSRNLLWPLRALALFGIGWNLFGIVQFLSTVTAPLDHLRAMGMDAAQAALYLGLPVWLDIVFAVGVFGGVLGSLLLLAGRRMAVPVLGLSLLGYLALYAGDIALGVFAAFGLGQVLLLSFVVGVAILLLLAARRAVHVGLVR